MKCVSYLFIFIGEDNRSHEHWNGHLYHTYYYPKEQIDYFGTDVSIRGKNIPKNDRDLIKNNIYVNFFLTYHNYKGHFCQANCSLYRK